MKKIMYVLAGLLLVMSLASQARTIKEDEHLKFMGIPLQGSVVTFGNEIIKKGCRPQNYAYRDMLGFSGTFAGYDADIYVKYHNREVYEAYAVVDRDNLEAAQSVYDDFCNSLQKKYPYHFDAYNYDKEYETYYLRPKRYPKDEEYNEDRVFGTISVKIVHQKNYGVYGVVITYSDGINSKVRERSKLDDF